MIRNSKQNWTVGSTVKVGFLTLTVKAALATPGDSMPDVYFLADAANTKLYEFTPHHGLVAVSLEQAAERMADLRAQIEEIAARETSQAIKRAQSSVAVNRLFGEVA
jgi:hypothetical protein